MLNNKTHTYYKQGSSFDHEAASLYDAVLLIDSHSAGVGFADAASGSILAMSLHSFDVFTSDLLKSFLESNKAQLQNARTVSANIVTPDFSLVPEVLFEEGMEQKLLATLTDLPESSVYRSDLLTDYESRLVYAFDSDIADTLRSVPGNTGLASHLSAMLVAYRTYYLNDQRKNGFVQLFDTHFSVALFDKRTLKFFNVFKYNSPEDVVYYYYYAIQQNGFDPAETQAHIGGFSENRKTLTELFLRYTKNVYHIESQCCPTMNKADNDLFINLIFAIQCGL